MSIFVSAVGCFRSFEEVWEARAAGIRNLINSRAKSPVANGDRLEGGVLLHPEFHLPMVWYVPPLSPIQSAAENDQIGMMATFPMCVPCVFRQYLANLLTAGKEEPSCWAWSDAGDASLYA
jgi:nitrate reductase beta subunit